MASDPGQAQEGAANNSVEVLEDEQEEEKDEQDTKKDPEPVKIFHSPIGTKPKIDSTGVNCRDVDNTEHRFLEIVGQNTLDANEKELNKVS